MRQRVCAMQRSAAWAPPFACARTSVRARGGCRAQEFDGIALLVLHAWRSTSRRRLSAIWAGSPRKACCEEERLAAHDVPEHPAFAVQLGMVSSEWALGGEVAYQLQMETLRPPGAVAIGAVTPAAPVNCQIAWAPGAGNWPHAWGYCMDGSPPLTQESEQRAAQWDAFLGRPGARHLEPCPAPCLPLLRQVDVVSVVLAPLRGALHAHSGPQAPGARAAGVVTRCTDGHCCGYQVRRRPSEDLEPRLGRAGGSRLIRAPAPAERGRG
uniref:Uncharacterized protein n=1 Tax=Alexandrium monilatum TaxID=311494 RepID=A0A7S4T9X9_9DINO